MLSTGVGALIHPPLAGVLPASVGDLLGEKGESAKHTAEMIAMGAMLAGLVIAGFLFAVDKGRFGG